MLLSSLIRRKDSTIMLQIIIDNDTIIRRIYQYLSLIGETLSLIRLSTEKLKIALNYLIDVNYCIFSFLHKGIFLFVCNGNWNTLLIDLYQNLINSSTFYVCLWSGGIGVHPFFRGWSTWKHHLISEGTIYRLVTAMRVPPSWTTPLHAWVCSAHKKWLKTTLIFHRTDKEKMKN